MTVFANTQQAQQSFWHPMAHPASVRQSAVTRIVSGEGVYVTDDKGQRMVDGVAGLWNVNLGHNRPEIKAAIMHQLDELAYYQSFDGVSHPRVEELSARLSAMLAPEQMARVMLSSGGSDAVETALKVSRQYWKLVGEPERTRFISLRQGYHGTHFGGTSINGSLVFRRNYEPLLPGCIQIDAPWPYRNPWNAGGEELGALCAAQLEREILAQGPDTVAAFIAEPVQGAGGVIVPPANFWPLVRAVCDKYGVLLIADEVVTGFGRSGNMFGCRGWGVSPDIICLAKGITSGYIPLGATLVNQRIAGAFEQNGNFTGALMHGYTYSGHPVACAAALVCLDLVEREQIPANAAKQGDYLLQALKPFEQKFAAVGEVRGKGLMLALDLVSDKASREPVDPMDGFANQIARVARAHGAMVRPVGTKIILSPPLTIQLPELDILVNALDTAFSQTAPVR
ncbi:aspartate aminotransferase family protein [Zobellella aerophila]|uniref:Aspartate aminotransferase family protein n=1 Tax=Zobellella aerophila TaxID=870480 RepID=A0ABP6VW08_9GAMM